MRIFSKISSNFTPNINSANVKNVAVKLQKSHDVFERSTVVKDTASKFRNTVVQPFAEFTTKGLMPKDTDKGSSYLKSVLEPFIKTIEHFNAHDTEKFLKLSMGSDHLPILKDGAKVNSDVRLFVQTMEEKMGKSIADVLK